MASSAVSLQPRPHRFAAWCRTAVRRAATAVRSLPERLALLLRHGDAAAPPDAITAPLAPSAERTVGGTQGTLKPARVLSVLIAAAMAVSSILGLAVPDLYEDPASVAAMFRGLDAVNLGVAVPSLLVAAELSIRGSLRGRLLWAGMLAYTLYTYVLYVFGLSFNAAFLLHAGVLSLAIYALVLVLAGIDTADLARQVHSGLPARVAGTLLGLLGLGLGGMWTYYAARFALTGQAPQESLLVQTPAGVHLSYAADLVLLVPACLVSAVLLWRLRPWGYVLGGTLLTSGVLQQVGYMAELAAQARAGIPGAVALDPGEPPILVAYLLGAVLLLVGIRPRAAVADEHQAVVENHTDNG